MVLLRSCFNKVKNMPALLALCCVNIINLKLLFFVDLNILTEHLKCADGISGSARLAILE